MTSVEKDKARYLWGFLLSLGFKPDAYANKRHVVLGETMFDKPNKEAFYIITYFLLEKLNAARTKDQFRTCYPVVDRKQDAEFRKLTLTWLQEIASESGGSFPKVMASQLLSPHGHKFVHIILSLAKHVMLEDIRSFHTDGSWVPRAVAVPSSSFEMAEKRLQVIRSNHLTAAMTQHRFNQEYHTRVKSWEKSVRQLMAEKAKYEELLESQESSPAVEEDQLQERAQKVRCLWAQVKGMLGALREQQCVMDRVLHGDVDKHTLDGAAMTVKLPTVLQHRLERREQTSRGGQSDSSQPSLLQLLDLFNEALALLNEERARAMGPTAQLRAGARSEGPMAQVDGELLRRLVTQVAQTQEELRAVCSSISTQDIPKTRRSIKGVESEWDRKWQQLLSDPVMTSVMRAHPGVEMLSAMAPLSCEPTPEDKINTNLLLLPPTPLTEPETEPLQRTEDAKVETRKPAEEKKSIIRAAAELMSDQEPAPYWGQTAIRPCGLESPRPRTPIRPCGLESPRPSSPVWLTPSKPVQNSPVGSVLEVKINTTKPVKAAETKGGTSAKAETQSQANISGKVETPKMSAVKKKQADILHMELENLAEQFALAVTTSPSGGAAEEGMSLEHLLSSMIQPLSARRQLPRTPEQILSEVRTSWRKVMEDSVTQRSSSSATTTTTTAARPSGKFPDSFTGLFTPFSEARADPSLNLNPDTSLYPNNTFTLSSSSNTEAATRAASVPLDVTYDNSAPLDVTTASSESFCLRPPVTPATMQYNTSGDQQGAAFPPLTTSFDSSISLSHRHHTETLGSSTTQRSHETEPSSNENWHEASALANHNSYEASALTNHSLYEVSALANPSSRDGFDFDFSLANESLPDLSSCDSLLANESLVSNTTASPSISRRDSDDMPEDEEDDDDDDEEEEDGGDDEKQEVKELVSPQFPSQPADGDNKAAAAVLYARQRLQAIRERATALDQDLNLLSFSPTPSTLAKGRGHGEEAGGWENHTSQQQQEPFFSLDLEELDSPAPSPRHHGDMRHLPNLLSFSPVKQL